MTTFVNEMTREFTRASEIGRVNSPSVTAALVQCASCYSRIETIARFT